MNDKWTFYKVQFNFITSLCGSVPGEPEMIAKWLENRQPRVRPPGGKSIDEINEEVFATLPGEMEEEKPSILIFQRNPTNGANLVLRAATLRAHMKDCARVISKSEGRIQGESSFAVKVKNYVYHDEREYWIPILRPNGSLIIEADGKREKPIHVTDTRGRTQNALKCFEFIYPARIDFTLKIFNEMVPLKDLETLFIYGGVHGYGGERSDGEGRYTFSIQPFEEEKKKSSKKKGAEEHGDAPSV